MTYKIGQRFLIDKAEYLLTAFYLEVGGFYAMLVDVQSGIAFSHPSRINDTDVITEAEMKPVFASRKIILK